jgi:large subunit ribosomal protein L25
MEAILEATARESRGKNEARRTRASGRVPAVLYGASSGGKNETTAISVEPKALLRILHSEAGANTLISLKLAGAGDTRVLVKEYQLDPVTHQLWHRRLPSHRDGPRPAHHRVDHGEGRGAGRSSRAASSSTCTAASRSSACRPTSLNTSRLTSAT